MIDLSLCGQSLKLPTALCIFLVSGGCNVCCTAMSSLCSAHSWLSSSTEINHTKIMYLKNLANICEFNILRPGERLWNFVLQSYALRFYLPGFVMWFSNHTCIWHGKMWKADTTIQSKETAYHVRLHFCQFVSAWLPDVNLVYLFFMTLIHYLTFPASYHEISRLCKTSMWKTLTLS